MVRHSDLKIIRKTQARSEFRDKEDVPVHVLGELEAGAEEGCDERRIAH